MVRPVLVYSDAKWLRSQAMAVVRARCYRYSNTSLIRTPLIRILRNSDRFRPPENFQVIFTPLLRIPATSRRDNSDTFPAEID